MNLNNNRQGPTDCVYDEETNLMDPNRIFGEERDINEGCEDPVPDPTVPYDEGEASCLGGYYCNNESANNYGVLQNVVIDGGNTCPNSSLCEFDIINEEGEPETVVGVDPIYGCTDPEASNYSPTATYDNGLCTYESEEEEEEEPSVVDDEGVDGDVTDEDITEIYDTTDSEPNYAPYYILGGLVLILLLTKK